VKYLQSPESFIIMEWVSFEDFLLNEYFKNRLDSILNMNADSIQEKFNVEELKESILQEFKRQRKRRVEKELYLNITFAEDIARSQVELIKVIGENQILCKGVKNLKIMKDYVIYDIK